METPTIIYAYDALCGWCYGFSPVMQRLYDTYREQLHVEVLSGGMVTGERIGPIGQVAPYISWAYKEVENRTGVKFGEAFLNGTLKSGTTIFSSIQPAIALSVFKSYHPERAVEFAGQLQQAVYFDGIEPENVEAYGTYAEKFGISAAEFTQRMQENAYRQQAFAEFKLVSKLGVTGFPTVFLQKVDKLYVIARGYMDFDQLNQSVENLFTKA